MFTRMQTQSKCGDTDKPCKARNRCYKETRVWQNEVYEVDTEYPQSWDAYVFRPPLPTLRADYLTPSVYMNMINAENRAAAALFLAGVAGPHYPVENYLRQV